jgi:hypothetical protein
MAEPWTMPLEHCHTSIKRVPSPYFPNDKFFMKMLTGNFNAEVGREDIFKPKIVNDTLYEINYDNGVRVVNFATSKNLTVKSTMFSHCNIHKCTWASPDGKNRQSY